MKIIGVLIVLVGLAKAFITYDDVLEAEFQYFKEEYNKTYDNHDEEELRMQIFKDNKGVIDRHNKRYAAGETTYHMGVNQFTDMLPTEFENVVLTCVQSGMDMEDTTCTSSSYDAIPVAFDWREKKAVTPVKYQENCKACWAFSVIGALESHNFIKTQRLVNLSVQNLIDCSKIAPYNNNGCSQGSTEAALRYIKENGGVNAEESYPYKASDKLPCRFDKNKIRAKVAGIVKIRNGDEDELAKVIATKGPVSVAIDSSYFQHYKGGILNEPKCKGDVNHAALIVGYGTEKGLDYWIVKNSWGVGWGEQGYIRMARKKGNQCKIASYAIYPMV